ncbi:MAG: MFS transporter [Victivallaceae bacterium]
MAMTKEEKGWIWYDIANSVYSLIIITTIMPVFFKSYASAGIPDATSTANWGIANSVASLIIALLAPALGAMADRPGRKKRFFAFFLLIGLISTLMLTMIGHGQWILALVIFTVSVVGYSGANVFYDSFLVDVTTHERMDWISSAGYALGYIASVLPMVIILLMFHLGGNGNSVTVTKLAFVITAVWWGALSAPMLRNVKQKYHSGDTVRSITGSFLQLFNTFREIRKYRNAMIFLGAYFLYIDGIGTIVKMAVPYGQDLGLTPASLVLVVLGIQIVACPCALLYGRLAEKYTARRLITAGIIIYTFITFIGSMIPLLQSRDHRLILFWALAMMIATSQGGVQSLSRSFFGKLIPKENSAEFFGFYNVFGKFAAVARPLLMAVMIELTGQSCFGFLSIGFLFIAGLWLFLKIKPEKPGITS